MTRSIVPTATQHASTTIEASAPAPPAFLQEYVLTATVTRHLTADAHELGLPDL